MPPPTGAEGEEGEEGESVFTMPPVASAKGKKGRFSFHLSKSEKQRKAAAATPNPMHQSLMVSLLGTTKGIYYTLYYTTPDIPLYTTPILPATIWLSCVQGAYRGGDTVIIVGCCYTPQQ